VRTARERPGGSIFKGQDQCRLGQASRNQVVDRQVKGDAKEIGVRREYADLGNGQLISILVMELRHQVLHCRGAGVDQG